MTKYTNLQQRRNAVMEYLLEFGPFGIPMRTKEKYAQDWGCCVRTIEHDIDKLIDDVKIPVMKKLGQKFLLTYTKAMKTAQTLAQDEDPHVRAKGLKLINQTEAHYTKMCEKYGFKEVVADRLAIEGEFEHKVGTIEIIMPSQINSEGTDSEPTDTQPVAPAAAEGVLVVEEKEMTEEEIDAAAEEEMR